MIRNWGMVFTSQKRAPGSGESTNMSFQSTGQVTSDVRSVMQPRRPAVPGKIEKARDPQQCLKRVAPLSRSL